MIITKLMGGLGNQMFQYAAARTLADKLGVQLEIDTSFLSDRSDKKDFTYRDFELSCFNIRAGIIEETGLNNFIRTTALLDKIKVTAANRILFHNKLPIAKRFVDGGFTFNKDLLSLSDNTLLEGYWQSEKYFAGNNKHIKTDLTFRNEAVGKNAELVLLAKSINSVSIHIRRGDYAANAHINSVHGLCDVAYYLRSIELLKNKVADPVLFFFSDDMEWVKQTFSEVSGKYKTEFIDNNTGSQSFEDMRIMSNCKHNIIANSSFSWWGAWLNGNEDKIVIAPARWFADTSVNTGDMVPSSWIRI